MMSLAGRWRRQGFDVDFATLSATRPSRPGRIGSRRLPRCCRRHPPGEPAPDADSADVSGAPFPLAPMQHAMWVGRHDNQQFGGVAGHLYVEFDGGPTDPERLRAAATRLSLRHPMLRVRFLPDGTQRIDRPTMRRLSGRRRRFAAAGCRSRRCKARRDPGDQVAPTTRRRGIRTRVDVAARRAARGCTSIWTCKPPTR